MKKMMVVLSFMVLASIILVGCGATPTATPTAVPPTVPAKTLPDLGGKSITGAVENAYPPFNSIDASGQGVGWDKMPVD